MSGRLAQMGNSSPVTSTSSRMIQGSAWAISASQAALQTANSQASQADSSKPLSDAMLRFSGRIRRTAGISRSSSLVVVSPWTTRAARPDLLLTAKIVACGSIPASASSAQVRLRRVRTWKVRSLVSAPVTASVRITSSAFTSRSSASMSSMPRSSAPAAAARSRMLERISSKAANRLFWSAILSARSRLRKVFIGGRSSDDFRSPSWSSRRSPVLASKVSRSIASTLPKCRAT